MLLLILFAMVESNQHTSKSILFAIDSKKTEIQLKFTNNL